MMQLNIIQSTQLKFTTNEQNLMDVPTKVEPFLTG